MATTTRKSGILLHPTSLPGETGVGDLGAWAYRFIDFLAEAGQRLWQVLPLGPTGFGHSPYQAYSSMAGNPLLVSLQPFVERGWLDAGELRGAPPALDALAAPPHSSRVDFAAVAPRKRRLLKKAAEAFFATRPDDLFQEFEAFLRENASWLDDFARFAALREANAEAPWTEWRDGREVAEDALREHEFVQFAFFRQWRALKRYANGRGIEVIGDIPIFVAHDSADVWANRDLFDLDGRGNPLNVAGVPPDYFSETGQLWGNPLYRWDEMERTGYAWWVERVRAAAGMTDIVRLDHFRGFEKFWRIPAGAPTAAAGAWADGPGDRLFQALRDALGTLPFIAEDLGYITPEVQALRDRWGFPGMRVLQFAFGDESPDNPHKPYNFVRNCVAYTGTHDNDTTASWFAGELTRREGEAALAYMGSAGTEPVRDLVRLALASVADTVILPMQDVLGLGAGARMNTPATTGGNWVWRMGEDALRPEAAEWLRGMNRRYGRL
ncbi:MAG: 4-alpha-glucanotransferase [Acidobacteriota bacterium]|jgi:4-alpha-glucanotransferase|nr:4-alpha-glucanotransferase [Acidobacteriota bacterium]